MSNEENRIPRKWEFIGNELKKLGLEKESKTCFEFDEFLKKNIEFELAPKWILDFDIITIDINLCDTKHIKLDYLIHNVMLLGHYCTACKNFEFRCKKCSFGLKYGFCIKSNSKFSNLLVKLKFILKKWMFEYE